jgi:hypothetical protein
MRLDRRYSSALTGCARICGSGTAKKLEAWLYQLLEQVSMYDRNEAAAIARQYMKIQLETFGTSTHIPDPYAADAGTEQTDAAGPEPVVADSTAPEGDTPDNTESDPQRAFVHYPTTCTPVRGKNSNRTSTGYWSASA